MNKEDKKKEAQEVPMEIALAEEVQPAEAADEQPSEETVKPAKESPERPAGEVPSLKEAIQETAREDEEPLSANFTLRKILGGDILNAQLIRRQIWLILIIVGFTIVYVSNRYSCQKAMIEIDQLSKQLQKAKYKALSSSSELTEKSRESRILDMLKQNNDSVIRIASQPPYIISTPK